MKLAVIPARGGSKRIPRKNVRLFAGQPMLAYAVSVAQESRLFDAIVVSSEDAEILALAETLGATPLARSVTLAGDHTPTLPVIADAIAVCESWGWRPDPVCCVYPAVPFLYASDLIQALYLLNERQTDYVFSVAAFSSQIQRALRVSPDGNVRPFFPENNNARTQDLEPAYFDAGQFYWGKRSAWMEGKSVHGCGHAWLIPTWRAIDIDSPDDWTRAELFQQVLTQGNAP